MSAVEVLGDAEFADALAVATRSAAIRIFAQRLRGDAGQRLQRRRGIEVRNSMLPGRRGAGRTAAAAHIPDAIQLETVRPLFSTPVAILIADRSPCRRCSISIQRQIA
jgi:hypothetical protein